MARSHIITPLAVIIGLGAIVSVRSFSQPRFRQQKENSIRKAFLNPGAPIDHKADRLRVRPDGVSRARPPRRDRPAGEDYRGMFENLR
jgi:hypothetical protein